MHCLWLRGKRRDVELDFRPQAFKYFLFLSIFCIFPFLKVVLIAAPQTLPPLQESVGVLGGPEPLCYQRKKTLLSLIPSQVGPLARPAGWPHPLINMSKCTAAIPRMCCLLHQVPAQNPQLIASG